jgi:GNAT superfamily N-acetyltransferase
MRTALISLIGEYHVFMIYHKSLRGQCLNPAETLELQFSVLARPGQVVTALNYSGKDSFGFAIRENEAELCTCWVWFGERYLKRNYWPLKHTHAKLIALETEESARGKGLAPMLLQYAARVMADHGFTDLYARIWHSNHPSRRAFRKAGWRFHALVLEFDALGNRRRIVLPANAFLRLIK